MRTHCCWLALLSLLVLPCVSALAWSEARAASPAGLRQRTVQTIRSQTSKLGLLAGRFGRRTGLTRLRLKVSARLRLTSAYCTLAADRLEGCLPTGLARGFGRLRLASPGAMSSFVAAKFRQDPGFLATYGVASPIAFHLSLPVVIAAGVNPALALVGHELIEMPVNFGVILWRQHHLERRKNPDQTFGGTLRALGQEYRSNAERAREGNRRFLRLQQRLHRAPVDQAAFGQVGTLQQLGSQLN